MHDGGDRDRRVDLFFFLLLALDEFGCLLDGVTSLLILLFLVFTGFFILGGFVGRFDLCLRVFGRRILVRKLFIFDLGRVLDV
jgi:hypothetical protein